jgi:hypothetical protein
MLFDFMSHGVVMCCFVFYRYKAFRDLLVSTAIQGIEEAFKLQSQETKVSKDFHILKG